MDTMMAANLHAPGDLRVELVPMPVIESHEVLVKVSCCGICGSDVPRVNTSGTYHFPTIPGHEFAGTATAVGASAHGVREGDRVAVIPLIPCRICRMCERGYYAQCASYDFLGSRSDGGFAQYVRVPASNTVQVPARVPDEAAAMLEPAATTLHAVRNLGVSWGDTVVVFGLGAIGNLTAQWARAFGASRVFAVDVVDGKVDIARRCGLPDATTTTGEDLAAMVDAETGGYGVDAVFDASGSPAALDDAIKLLRPFGRLGLIGRPGRPVSLSDPAFERILRYQLTIAGNWSFEFTSFPHHAWRESAKAMDQGQLVVEPLITHRYPLERIAEGVRLMAEKRPDIGKIVILPHEEG